jgi:hypothetical protein
MGLAKAETCEVGGLTRDLIRDTKAAVTAFRLFYPASSFSSLRRPLVLRRAP